MTNYTSTATKRDRYWFVQCDQHPGAMSQVTRLDQAADIHREAIAFVADVPEESVHVTVTPVLPQSVVDDITEVARLREVAAFAERDATAHHRRAAAALRAEGLTIRDIGAVLGVSHQRAHQLLVESATDQVFADRDELLDRLADA